MTMKLLICIPTLDYIHADFVKSLMALCKRLDADKIQYDVQIHTGTLVYVGRDKLAKIAVNGDYTHALWLDADMVFADSLVDDLLFPGKPFVCGLFISRHSPYCSCLFSKLYPPERITQFPDAAFQVAGCGFGAVLMETRVMRDVMMANTGKCFLPEALLGEDLAFCRRARNLGYEIWCEPTARVGYIGHVTIWPEDGQRLLGEISGKKWEEMG